MTSPKPTRPRPVASPRNPRRCLVTVMLAMLAAIFASLLASEPASAQGADTVIQVQVKNQRREGGRAANEPVAGVSITVLDADGNEIGSGVTDEKGIIAIPVPGRADYVVRLDESTLPPDSSLAAQTPAEQSVNGESFVTARRIVNYFTGDSQRTAQSTFDRWSQRLADGVRLGLVIAMCSVGLSLIFGTTGLTNFAHGEMVTFGALVAWVLNKNGLHIVFAALIALVAGGLLGYGMDRFGFARLRARGVGLITQMVITIGLSIIAKNFFLFRFGGRDQPYFDYTNQIGRKYGPVLMTPRDLVVMLLSVIVLVGVAITLQFTRLGKATRAVSDNVELASATGIDTTRVIRLIWVAAGALAALGGVFRGLDEQVAWDMGTALLFLMFAAITLGGLGSAYGALLGGFIVGVMVEMSTLFGVPSELKTVPALLVLVLILLVRPQGVLGRAQRVG